MVFEIGQQIKTAREQSNLALEEIANRTRINLSYLRDIEAGKFDFLPRPYVLAFTKTFANQVGLNGEEIAKQLLALLAGPQTSTGEVTSEPAPVEARHEPAYASSVGMHAEKVEHAAKTPNMPYLREILIGIGIVIAVVIALILAARSSQEEAPQGQGETRSGTRAENVVPEMTFEEMAKQVAALTDSQAKAEVVAPQQLTLEARLDAPVWMRVITDNADTVAQTYPRGSAQWQAKDNFVLRVGNAGAVTFVLDGKVLGKVGEPGQRVNIMVTREGFKEKRVLPPPRPRVAADSSGT